MYLFGVKKWYYNWVLLIIAGGVCPLLAGYMYYRMLKDAGTFG